MGRGGYRGGRSRGRVVSPKVQTFDEFYARNRAVGEADSSFLRGRANVSNRQIKMQNQRYAAEVTAKYDEKAVLKAKYDQLVSSGAIREPSRFELAVKAAQGHPDNPATQAAKRLLEKYKARGFNG